MCCAATSGVCVSRCSLPFRCTRRTRRAFYRFSSDARDVFVSFRLRFALALYNGRAAVRSVLRASGGPFGRPFAVGGLVDSTTEQMLGFLRRAAFPLRTRTMCAAEFIVTAVHTQIMERSLFNIQLCRHAQCLLFLRTNCSRASTIRSAARLCAFIAASSTKRFDETLRPNSSTELFATVLTDKRRASFCILSNCVSHSRDRR